ncbi:hypothetical protein SE91_27375 [Bradyrhizobium sp. DOA1]|nr:hypothetical protein SE91_27375 [Bradyrhizobium sp. DOA1]
MLQVLRVGYKRMLQEKRKRGGQPGNFNALKHGRRSPRKRAERREKYQAAADERRAGEKAWAAALPKTDYGAICDLTAAHEARMVRKIH